MELRVGTDLVQVARVEHLIGAVGEAFLARTWTPAERTASQGRAESLAARWAAKEATMKALGVGVGSVAMTEIEVGQGPSLQLHGRAAELAADQGLTDWAVSLSHDGGFALAFVVAVGDGRTGSPEVF